MYCFEPFPMFVANSASNKGIATTTGGGGGGGHEETPAGILVRLVGCYSTYFSEICISTLIAHTIIL